MALHSAAGRGALIRVFVLAFLVYAYFMPRWADWNIDSRLDLVHAMVDHASFSIDPFHWNTWDKAVCCGSNPHFYSDKAPGTAFLGAGVYALLAGARALPGSGGVVQWAESSGGWNVAIRLGRTNTQAQPAPRGTNLGGCQRAGTAGNVQYIPWGNRLVPPFRAWALSKYVVSVGVVSLLSALFVTFFFWFLGLFTRRALVAWFLTALYAVGTVALPYSTVFYSHQLVAGFLFTSFALLFLCARGNRARWLPTLAGFLLGMAFLTEYTVALAIALVGVYALYVLRYSPLRIVPFAVAAAIPLTALFAYNSICFGSPLDTGYTHDFCWSAAQSGGFAGFTYPHLDALRDLTFGPYRGLFFTSPFLLLTIPGLVAMARRGFPLEAALCAASALLFILAISAYWGWNGGRVDGPRYLVPIVPFLAFPILFHMETTGRRAVWWVILLAAGGWSVFATWAEFLGGESFPISWDRNPLFDYSLPALGANQVAPNAGQFLGLSGWSSLLPLALLLGFVAAFQRVRTAGKPRTTRAVGGVEGSPEVSVPERS